MAIWDKVKGFANDAANTLNDAAKDVSNGAKELQEKSRIKRDIKTQEQKIENAYKTIGEKFYKENASAPNGYQQQFNDIKNAAAEIEKLKAELEKKEATGKCPKCGASISQNQAFCQHCGNNLK